MAIKLIQSFDMRSAVPLDNRAVVQNLTDIPTFKLYEGLLVYQRSNKKYYKYEDSTFTALTEALGVTSFNDRAGSVSIIPGNGINITELDLGQFTIDANGVLFTDGSNGMDVGYVPTEPQHVVTKQYLEDNLSSITVKIDDDSIKQNLDDELYVNSVNGGEF